jgi:hypothetical protein
LFRCLLSDIQADNTPHFRLLKNQTQFSNEKMQAMVSFGHALEHIANSDTATAKIDLSSLFQRLSFDSLDNIIFSIPLFSGTNHTLIEQGKESF